MTEQQFDAALDAGEPVELDVSNLRVVAEEAYEWAEAGLPLFNEAIALCEIEPCDPDCECGPAHCPDIHLPNHKRTCPTHRA